MLLNFGICRADPYRPPLAPSLLLRSHPLTLSLSAMAAFFGAALARRISDERLVRVILALLMGIGTALIVEDFNPFKSHDLLPDLPALSGAGNNLIVEHIVETEEWMRRLLRLPEPFDVFFVGIHCPLPELERRERESGDRRIGEARRDYEITYTFGTYDFEIDSTEPVERNVEAVIAAWKTRMPMSAFDRMDGLLMSRCEPSLNPYFLQPCNVASGYRIHFPLCQLARCRSLPLNKAVSTLRAWICHTSLPMCRILAMMTDLPKMCQ